MTGLRASLQALCSIIVKTGPPGRGDPRDAIAVGVDADA